LILVPSLWQESFGRVAAEAVMNGIPVIASDRGALPEVLVAAGRVLPIPARHTPSSRLAPTADELAPWVEAIERYWADPLERDAERARCLDAAAAWHPDVLMPHFEAFFRAVAAGNSPKALLQIRSLSIGP